MPLDNQRAGPRTMRLCAFPRHRSIDHLGLGGARNDSSQPLADEGAALCPHPDDPQDPELLVAMRLARANDYTQARSLFERVLQRKPDLCRVWVSYAQMEKRCPGSDRWERCRLVLQRGLSRNNSSACLIQAWGLMELQRGNWYAAVKMLERAVLMDPSRNSPVLRWTQVETARKTVGSRRARASTSSNAQGSSAGNA